MKLEAPALSFVAGQRGAPAERADRARAAEKYIAQCGRDAALELTSALVAFPTVSAEAPAPKAPAFAAMADALKQRAERAGLGFEVVGDHDAWEITLGAGKPLLAFVAHGDVVPAGEAKDGALPAGWSSDPFVAKLVDGKLYGRGTQDDKGPIAAAFVVMAAMKAFGLEPDGQLRLAIGLGEESDWGGMRRYVKSREHPPLVISIDADFPVVIAESGFVAAGVKIARTAPKPGVKARVAEVKGGEFLTQIPGEATMILLPAKNQRVEDLKILAEAAIASARKALAFPDAAADRAELADGKVKITVHGTSAHSSTADEANNATWLLAEVAGALDLEPSPEASMLAIVRKYFTKDHYGERLGLAYEHPVMGKLLVAPTVLRTEEKAVVLEINMRRPAGKTSPEFTAALTAAIERLKKDEPKLEPTEPPFVGEPALAKTDGPLVPALTAIYREVSGDAESQPISIRGGTYARLFEGAVSFGPGFPKKPYRGHAADEYIEVVDLERVTRMLLLAAMRLTAGG